jgi:hypothetical protein
LAALLSAHFSLLGMDWELVMATATMRTLMVINQSCFFCAIVHAPRSSTERVNLSALEHLRPRLLLSSLVPSLSSR